MSTVRIYRWDDAGAPTLSGTVGSLTALLRACLVGVAGVAYGSVASAGWTEQFIGAASNIAVFRNDQAGGGSGCYVRVNDNAPGAGGAREARVNVYATMSDVNTGTIATATYFLRKSTALNSTARKWVIVADEFTAWVYVFDTGDTAGSNKETSVMCFGDYACVDAASSTNYLLIGRTAENEAAGGRNNAFTGGTTSMNDQTGLSIGPLDGVSASTTAHIAWPHQSSGSTAAIGGQDFASGSHPITGDYYYQDYPALMDGSVLAGRVRGLVAPYFRLDNATNGGLAPGSTSMIAMGGNYNNGASTTAFGVALDFVGPWP